MTYDPWKRVDELEAKVRELEARLRALEQPEPALLRRVDAVGGSGGKATTETLHLPKGKH